MVDSGPLGLVTNPKASLEATECKEWLRALPKVGHIVLVPEIVDYELRRELHLYNRSRGLQNLDAFKAIDRYLPLTTQAMLKAAELWAVARRTGIPTADKLALDADMILAAQALTLDPISWGVTENIVVIATTNVGHLTRFATAKHWREVA